MRHERRKEERVNGHGVRRARAVKLNAQAGGQRTQRVQKGREAARRGPARAEVVVRALHVRQRQLARRPGRLALLGADKHGRRAPHHEHGAGHPLVHVLRAGRRARLAAKVEAVAEVERKGQARPRDGLDQEVRAHARGQKLGRVNEARAGATRADSRRDAREAQHALSREKKRLRRAAQARRERARVRLPVTPHDGREQRLRRGRQCCAARAHSRLKRAHERNALRDVRVQRHDKWRQRLALRQRGVHVAEGRRHVVAQVAVLHAGKRGHEADVVGIERARHVGQRLVVRDAVHLERADAGDGRQEGAVVRRRAALEEARQVRRARVKRAERLLKRRQRGRARHVWRGAQHRGVTLQRTLRGVEHTEDGVRDGARHGWLREQRVTRLVRGRRVCRHQDEVRLAHGVAHVRVRHAPRRDVEREVVPQLQRVREHVPARHGRAAHVHGRRIDVHNRTRQRRVVRCRRHA